LYRLTSGNPFYVTEVVRSGLPEVPPSARDAVLARVGRLSAEARGVLEVAALVGARIEPSLLESVTAGTALVLDELLASVLLGNDGSWLKFRHEIARLAVQDAIGPHRASGIHARILTVLRDNGVDDDAGLAYHAEAAGDAVAALEYACRAASRAVELASHREA